MHQHYIPPNHEYSQLICATSLSAKNLYRLLCELLCARTPRSSTPSISLCGLFRSVFVLCRVADLRNPAPNAARAGGGNKQRTP